MNSRSINNKKDSIYELITDNDLNVLALTETWCADNSDVSLGLVTPPGYVISPGAKMGIWKSLRVQGFMIDPEAIGVLKEIKLGCHDGNLGELFYLHNS